MRDVEDEFAGVLGRTHHANRIGRLGQWVVRAFRHWQRTVGGQSVDGGQQFPHLGGMGDRHQPQVDGVEREIAPEREESHPGVAVDVALPDLDESPAEGQ